AASQTDDEGTKKYGIVEGVEVEPNVLQLKSYMEKPGPEATSSRTAVLGAYLFTPEIFDHLKRTKPGKGGEIWLVDAISELQTTRPVYVKKIDGRYYDTGSKLGWLRANVELGLQHPDFGGPFRDILKEVK
ncbi:MAG: UTP--glucose-1-phosphate uridylyltransferase, partial [Candidatus Kerfeldbacteria bacterium]|nr:UTP--glucose-1-phosphate uridylyltransferase [Candidatus Kerfeldbacteria bacterium]